MESIPKFSMQLTVNKTISSIARIELSSLTPKIFFEKYQKTGTPVLITGLAVGDWNIDYLCEQLAIENFSFVITDDKDTDKINVPGKILAAEFLYKQCHLQNI